MKQSNQSQSIGKSPVMGLAEAMKTMGQVLRGEVAVPKDFPQSKTYFNDEAAKTWHEARSRAGQSVEVAHAEVARAPKRKAGVPNSTIASSSQFAAFAKLFVDNGVLLRVLAIEGADSAASLARRLKKDPGNVRRTLNKLEVYGVVRFVSEGSRVKRPVLATEEVDFKVNFKSGQIRLTA